MKKLMLVMTISFVVITVAVFFVYPYWQRPSPENLEGVYIRYIEHEFGKEWDTLVLHKGAGVTGHYLIVRRWRYERLLDGKLVEPEYKRSTTAAQFMEKEGVLLEEESGIRYTYNKNRKELLAGTTIYKKTN